MKEPKKMMMTAKQTLRTINFHTLASSGYHYSLTGPALNAEAGQGARFDY